MNSLSEIKSDFSHLIAIHQSVETAIEDKIKERKKQLERLENRLRKLPPFPRWTELLLRPIINQIKPHFPDWTCDDERLTPMGLGSRVSVFFTNKKETDRYIYIVFVPVDISGGELNYETGESHNRFAKDTIGEINGFNRVTKPVESIDELIEFLKTQIVNENN